MTISTTLFKAILSMDSYNRGYGQGLILPNVLFGQTKIGNAIISNDSLQTTSTSGGVAAGFYAIAYTLSSGEKVISYRGTDKNFSFPFWDDVGSDMWNGYGTALGNPSSLQSQLALKFYQAVAGAGVDPRTANISLTGHSLGGGLAGYVGSVYGKSGLLFNNMSFEAAASSAHDISSDPNFYALQLDGSIDQQKYIEATLLKFDIYGTATPWAINGSGLQTYYTEGEFLEADRTNQVTPKTMLDLGAGVDLPGADSGVLSFSRHSISNMVIRMFADEVGIASDWKNAAKYFMPSLYKNDVGFASGAGSVTGTMNADHDYAGILRTAIAYSAIDNGGGDVDAYPFGDTGIRSLFNDANDLGKVVGFADASSSIKDNAAAISDIFTQFSGQMALGKILQIAAAPANDNFVFKENSKIA